MLKKFILTHVLFFFSIFSYCFASATTTLDPTNSQANLVFSNGNLTVTNCPGSTWCNTYSTFSTSTGKWYWEVTIDSTAGNNLIGVSHNNYPTDTNFVGTGATDYGYYTNGNVYQGLVASSCGASYTTGDIISIALDLDGNTLKYYKNGSLQCTRAGVVGTYYAGLSLYINTEQNTVNFGATSFTYSVPSGYSSGFGDDIGSTVVSSPDLGINGTDFNFNLSTSTIFTPDFTPCDTSSISFVPFSMGTFSIPGCAKELGIYILFGNGLDLTPINNFRENASTSIIFFPIQQGMALRQAMTSTSSTGITLQILNATTTFFASSSIINSIKLPDTLDSTIANMEYFAFYMTWAIIYIIILFI